MTDPALPAAKVVAEEEVRAVAVDAQQPAARRLAGQRLEALDETETLAARAAAGDQR